MKDNVASVLRVDFPIMPQNNNFTSSHFYDELTSYTLVKPDENKEIAILLDAPHIGDFLPGHMNIDTNVPLDSTLWHQGKDYGIAELINGYKNFGITGVESNICRSFIDLNRSTNGSATSKKNDFIDYEPGSNPSKLTDLGLIWEHFPNGKKIYSEELPLWEKELRLNKVHAPYHEILEEQLLYLSNKFNHCLHLNMHSMPMYQVSAHDPNCDLVIGNLHERSANKEITSNIIQAFIQQGFRVSLNKPFAGGECISRMIENPSINAVQLEFNRDKFWNTQQHRPAFGFADFRSRMMKALKDIIKQQKT